MVCIDLLEKKLKDGLERYRWHKVLPLPILFASFALETLLPSAAQPRVDCNQEVFDTAQRMQAEYGLNILQPSARPIDASKQTPYPGSLERTFLMITSFSGPGSDNLYTRNTTMKARDFMNSPRLQLQLATRILNACRDTSIVTFGFANSGYMAPYFRMPSGLVRPGIGLDCDRRITSIQWGYFFDC